MSEVLQSVAGYHDSHTPVDIRDLWQTPPEIFSALNREFRFVADVAASKLNHLLPNYLTEKDDALNQDWAAQFPIGITWCNPPYSDITPWVSKASEEASKGIKRAGLISPF